MCHEARLGPVRAQEESVVMSKTRTYVNQVSVYLAKFEQRAGMRTHESLHGVISNGGAHNTCFVVGARANAFALAKVEGHSVPLGLDPGGKALADRCAGVAHERPAHRECILQGERQLAVDLCGWMSECADAVEG